MTSRSMTFLDDTSSRGRSPSFSDLKRRYYQKRCFQKKYLSFWILAAIFPFMLLRLMFFLSISSVPTAKSPAGTAVIVKSQDLLLHRHLSIISGSAPATRPDAKSGYPQGSPINGDAFSVHDDHGRNSVLLADSGKHSGPSPDIILKQKVKVKKSSKRHQSVTQDEDNFGVPEDNEMFKDDPEDDPMAWMTAEKAQNEKQTGESTGVAQRIDNDNKETKRAEDRRYVADDASRRRKSSEEDRKVREQEETEKQKRADEQRQPEEKQLNKDKAAEERGAEEQRVKEEQKQDNERRQATHKHADEKKQATEREQADKLYQVADKENDEVKFEDIRKIKEVTFPTDVDQREKAATGGECDLFDGGWEYDPEGPLYTNWTCPHVQGAQNCMSNGRPDTEYLHWKWKPQHCDLPRFDARAFLKAFKGKTIGFVGDSLARNQMQSLLCMLSQIEGPTQVSEDHTVRWLYDQHQVTVAAVWSPYLLRESNEGILGFEKGQSVLYLDELDSSWTSVLPEFDIVVLSIGQWYFKPSVYIKQDEVIGCHFCPMLNLTEIGFYDPYRSGVRQVLEKVATDFKGVVIMSTFAISHFEDGPWQNGGQCRRERPLNQEEGARIPGDHYTMHDIVMGEFNSFAYDKSKRNDDVHLEFLDVTKVSLLRADGHPGAYRRKHPYEGKSIDEWVPSDCLHWCLPGPVDTWNQLLVNLVHKHL